MKELSLNRRKFLAGTGAIVAASAMAGCSSDGGESYVITGTETEIPGTTMPTDEVVYNGSSPANCGARCVLAVHIRNGVIKRLTTDERPDRNLIDGSGDDPQRRACLKCRGKKGWFYRPDRILYPLKQTKERGDITGFKRISWDEAASEIDKIIGDTSNLMGGDPRYPDLKFPSAFNWGKGAFGHGHDTGDNGYVCSAARMTPFFLSGYGVSHQFRNGMFSFPQTSMVIHSFLSSAGEPVAMCSSKQDMLNAEFVVLWGLSMMDGAQDGGMWYFTQARDMKKDMQFVSVDTFVTRTSQILDAKNICPIPGTDSAMLAAMMTHLLDRHIEECDSTYPLEAETFRYKHDSKWLKLSEIEKYTIGFFDDLNPELYRHGRAVDGFAIGQSIGQTVTAGTIAVAGGKYKDGTPFAKGDTLSAGVIYYKSNIQHDYDGAAGPVPAPDSKGQYGVYAVPAGASYSAYLFGNDNKLVKAGLNIATSIYPDTVGYHARPPKHLGPNDPGNRFYDKATPIYGQVKKTPAWASKICGVPEADIKWLAEQVAVKKTFFLSGGGAGGAANRAPEGEQIGLALCTMAAITGCFGESGRSFGVPSAGRLGRTSFNSTSFEQPAGMTNMVGAMLTHQTAVNNICNLNKTSYHNISLNPLAARLAPMASDFMLTKREHNLWQDHGEYGGTGKSKWYDPSVMFTPPYKVMLSAAGNIVNQSADVLENIRVLTERDSNGKYKLEHMIMVEPFMTTSAQYSDYILPASLHFEKQSSGAQSQPASESFMNIPKVIDAPGEAKSELEIFELIADKSGRKAAVNGNLTAYDTMRRYFNALKKDHNLDTTWEEFQKSGIVTVSGTDRNKLYIAYEDYRKDPRLNPLTTVTGKFQIYSQSYMEDFETRRMCNFDQASGSGDNGKLVTALDINGDPVPGRIFTKACQFTGELQTAPGGKKYVDKPAEFIESDEVLYTSATLAEREQNERQVRFIYPIPMHIPQPEGMHACDSDSSAPVFKKGQAVTSYTKHPNILSINTDEYNFVINSFHALWRAHSTHNNITYTNETYKVGDDRKSTFLSFERELYTAADGQQIATAWDLGVYEPVFMNPSDAAKFNPPLEDGERIIIESTHEREYINPQNPAERIPHKAKVFAAVRFSENQRPGCLKMAEGGWASYLNLPGVGPIDIGGSINTLMDKEPGRYGKGSVNAGGCRVKLIRG